MEYRNKKIKLFQLKKDCCGCGACMNICSKKAIFMREDKSGFIYPEVNTALCINCGKCKKVCAFQNKEETNEPLETWAAVSRNKVEAAKSASGGVFAAMAGRVLEQKGYVFGAAFTDDWSVHHIGIHDKRQLFRLQGSKYVQSFMDNTYYQTRCVLEEGKMVLFSGCPCQIAGLKAYLGKEYKNLLTVDIICHGVPNYRMFQGYILMLEAQEKGKIMDFTFRNKKVGWGKNGQIDFVDHNGQIKNKKLWQNASSYIYYFSKGWIYRENCYYCKYAGKNRPADLTLGDYWGIEKVHPDYIGKNGWKEQEGISVIIVNTEKGSVFLKQMCPQIDLKKSTFEKAASGNGQLRHPSFPGQREEILIAFEKGGWDSVEEYYLRTIGLKRYTSQWKSLIPISFKRLLKRVI